MSNRTFEELLREVLVELREVIEYEKPPDAQILPKDKLEVMRFYEMHYSSLYVRYLMIYKKLEECYNMLLQPQKRRDIKLILERTIGRLLEVRKILIQLVGEYFDMDNTLVDLKQTPQVLEVIIPRYFIEDNEKELKRREILLELLMQRHNIEDLSAYDPDLEIDKQPQMSIQQAILIIQTNERGRQGRQAAKFKKELKLREERVRRVVELGEHAMDRETAALTIHKVWKGYLSRKETKEKVKEEAEYLGMNHKLPTKEQEQVNVKVEQTYLRRKLLQRENERELVEESVTMRNRIMKEEGPKMKEDMHDAIIEQILLYRQDNPEKTTHGLPNFPSEADGGSKRFMADLSTLPSDVADKQKSAAAAANSAKDPSSKQPSNPKRPTSSSKPQKPQQQQQQQQKNDPSSSSSNSTAVLEIAESKFDIIEAVKLLIYNWGSREDSPLDFYQKYEPLMLREQLMHGEKGIEEELRREVDEKIRQELNNLKLQLESETKTKNPKVKRGGKKNAKKVKNLDSSQQQQQQKNTEPFLSELVFLGVCKKIPKVKLSDFIGGHHLLGSLLESWDQPSMGQVRQTIAELILAMGSEQIHLHAPHTKSILLFGPERTGKTMLAHVIANELGATFFDLSPMNIAGKNEGVKETAIMIKMVFEVARSMQPSVIYMDDFEYVLKAKGKKGKKGGMRLKKELLLQVKSLKPGERILLVANSREPWDGDTKAWEGFFDRMIQCVLPDYGCCQELWRVLMEQRVANAVLTIHNNNSNSSSNSNNSSNPSTSNKEYQQLLQQQLSEKFDIHTLSLLSKTGYAAGSIAKVVKQVLTDRRMKRMKNQQLEVDEFITHLSKIDPVYKKVDVKFRQWVAKLSPNFRKRSAEDLQKIRDSIAEEKKRNQSNTNTRQRR